MPVTLWFAAPPRLWPDYEAPLTAALARRGIDARISPEAPDPAAVDYIVVANGAVTQDFSPFTRAKAMLNLWAGCEKLVGNPTLTMPLARMVEPALTEGMVEYVTGHVLRHHLGMDADIANRTGPWTDRPAPPLARERPVTMVGLGALGAAAAQALAGLGFPVTGWSRSPKDIPGLRCLSGPEGFAEALSGAQILVLLAPFTPQTENLIDAAALAHLAPGAVLINPARGQLIDDADLLAALDRGQLSHATLDVFRTEPLPADHPFWAHPGITVTPHLAAATRPASASEVIAENVARGEAGLPLLHLVDPQRGY
ncbi:NAD(P)-dependent oxidoreductase [Frigidibacter sp. MR17.14]|uniref:NAD(P)-dependent oxidoreductase n=1 Tax=Frigidibacter sp. MR17.14 TaxID=3126509 RepID=UPI003012E972